MTKLSSEKWNTINELVYEINSETSLVKLRKNLLDTIDILIPFDKGFIDLGYKIDTKVVFFDPVSLNIEERYLNSYYDDYEFVDTMFWFFSQDRADIYRESDFISPAMESTSVFYSDWLEPQNIHYSMGSKIRYEDILFGSINLWRSKEKGDYSDQDIEVMNVINKHLSLRFYNQFPKGIRKSKEHEYSKSLTSVYHITPREMEIIFEIYNGRSIREISELLYISQNTVKKHSHNIFKKMNIDSRTQLIKVVHDHISQS